MPTPDLRWLLPATQALRARRPPRAPVWPLAAAVAVGLGLLLAFQQVVAQGVAQAELRRSTAAAQLDAKARLKRESAACSVVRSADERANCLSEASTRFAGTRPANPDESPDILLRNALKRCEPLPDAERRDCVARMQGAGSTSGSAEGGGIYRELVTVEIGVAAEAPAKATTP